MQEIQTNWTKEELRAYLLIYCANADYIESEEELEMIKSKMDPGTYDKMHQEFDIDTDFQRILKIKSTCERYDYCEEDMKVLFEELKELFLSDGKYDILEQNIFRALKRLLK